MWQAALGGAMGGINPVMPHKQALDIWQTGQANRQAQRSAHTAMNFEEWMSSTAHQREVIDLKKAGLNPTLSAGGGGASSGGSSVPETFKHDISMPSIQLDPMQARKLDQDQERIEIDKAMAASTMAKNMTGNELTKAKTIVEKNGILGKSVGGDGMSSIKEAAKMIKQKALDYWNSNVPSNAPSSSGGELIPGPGMGQQKY